MQGDGEQTRQQAVGISWPRSARKLEVPMPATPRLNHRGLAVSPDSVSAAIAADSTVRASLAANRPVNRAPGRSFGSPG